MVKSTKSTTSRTSKQARSSGRSTMRAGSRGQQDAIAVLKQDHERVKQLLSRLEATTQRGADRRHKILGDVERELRMHTQLEEEIFYPAFEAAVKKRDEKELYHEAKEEHRIVDMLIPSLHETDPASDEFGGKVHALKEIVEHHIKEEERDMFPAAKSAIGKEELVMLGEQLMSRKRELQSMERAETMETDDTLRTARIESASARRMEWGGVADEPTDTVRDDDDEGQRPF